MQDCFKGFYFSLFPCSFACRFTATKLGFLVESVNLATLGENVVRLLFFFGLSVLVLFFIRFFSVHYLTANVSTWRLQDKQVDESSLGF